MEQEHVIVIDDIRSFPNHGGEFISPYVMIVLYLQGSTRGIYDGMPVSFSARELSIFPQGRVIKTNHATEDYRAQMILMSNAFFEKFKQINIYHFIVQNTWYEVMPSVQLSDEQFRQVNQLFDTVRWVCSLSTPHKEQMLYSLLYTLAVILYDFSVAQQKQYETPYRQLFVRFQQAVIEHYKESREVSSYADLLHMSKRYFSTCIRKETGVSAGEWINRYVLIRAKFLLTKYPDWTVQQVAYELGFNEVSAFCRFFKQQTTITPTAFRTNTKQTIM